MEEKAITFPVKHERFTVREYRTRPREINVLKVNNVEMKNKMTILTDTLPDFVLVSTHPKVFQLTKLH